MHRQDELNMMFEAIDEDGKNYILALTRNEYEQVVKLRRPTLRLVNRGQAIPDLAKSSVNSLPLSRPR